MQIVPEEHEMSEPIFCENKKNIISLSDDKFYQRVVKVNFKHTFGSISRWQVIDISLIYCPENRVQHFMQILS